MKIETNNIVLSIISADNFFYIFEKSEVLSKRIYLNKEF